MYLILMSATLTFSLHDALPILFSCTHEVKFLSEFLLPIAKIKIHPRLACYPLLGRDDHDAIRPPRSVYGGGRSEEHTSELQSRPHLVCRLLLEKKKFFLVPCLI